MSGEMDPVTPNPLGAPERRCGLPIPGPLVEIETVRSSGSLHLGYRLLPGSGQAGRRGVRGATCKEFGAAREAPAADSATGHQDPSIGEQGGSGSPAPARRHGPDGGKPAGDRIIKFGAGRNRSVASGDQDCSIGEGAWLSGNTGELSFSR
jgi:hypothetical protein